MPEDKNYFGDIYNSSSVLKDSSKLTIDYTVDDIFAEARYTFPSSMDTNQVARVRDFVANKYGTPSSSSGSVGLGDASFTWQMKDGIVVKVARGWPDTTTYLTFTSPENQKAMNDEIERLRKESEAKEYEKQNNAF